MNRREFLKSLAAMAAVSTAPVYFDMGKNLWRRSEQKIIGPWWKNNTFLASGDMQDGAVTAESLKKFLIKHIDQQIYLFHTDPNFYLDDAARYYDSLTESLYLRQEYKKT